MFYVIVLYLEKVLTKNLKLRKHFCVAESRVVQVHLCAVAHRCMYKCNVRDNIILVYF